MFLQAKNRFAWNAISLCLVWGSTSGQCVIHFPGYYRHDVPEFNMNYHTVTCIMYVISCQILYFGGQTTVLVRTFLKKHIKENHGVNNVALKYETNCYILIGNCGLRQVMGTILTWGFWNWHFWVVENVCPTHYKLSLCYKIVCVKNDWSHLTFSKSMPLPSTDGPEMMQPIFVSVTNVWGTNREHIFASRNFAPLL